MNKTLIRRLATLPSMGSGSRSTPSLTVRRPSVARGLLAGLVNAQQPFAASTVADIPLPAVLKASPQDLAPCAISAQLAADFADDLALYDKFVGELMETCSVEEVIKEAKPLFDFCVLARTKLQWHQLEHCCRSDQTSRFVAGLEPPTRRSGNRGSGSSAHGYSSGSFSSSSLASLCTSVVLLND